MASSDPPHDCPFCPRLVAFRQAARAREPLWHNAPVPSFGDPGAALLIVGLAPGLNGANRTGRPFTGDWAGRLLYASLLRYGFAHGAYRESPDDGLTLDDCRITNAIRCVPPANKPLPAEIATCRAFLTAALGEDSGLRAILALGRIAHESVVRAFGSRLALHAFAHGATHRLVDAGGREVRLFDSYHCSRYNTNTGVLTEAMFVDVVGAIRTFLETG